MQNIASAMKSSKKIYFKIFFEEDFFWKNNYLKASNSIIANIKDPKDK